MKKIFRKISEMIFLFHKFSFQTKLPKNKISERAGLFMSGDDYYGSLRENGFYIGKRPYKSFIIGHARNSFAPVFIGKITDESDVVTVSVIIRMSILVWIITLMLSVVFLISIVFYPLFLLVMYFAFFRPAKKMKEELVALLCEN